eukprot:4073326-Prymnesium_polylepis.2
MVDTAVTRLTDRADIDAPTVTRVRAPPAYRPCRIGSSASMGPPASLARRLRPCRRSHPTRPCRRARPRRRRPPRCPRAAYATAACAVACA